MPHERRRILEIELPLDVRPVHIDRLRAEMKLRPMSFVLFPCPIIWKTRAGGDGVS